MTFYYKFMVCNVEYSVYITPDLQDDDGTLFDGLTDYDACMIQLDESILINVNKFHRVLWHELAHAFAHESGLTELLSEDAQEMFAQTHSAFVMNTFAAIEQFKNKQ
jgi:Zn-dependent peptidase ImmA (M78 family)